MRVRRFQKPGMTVNARPRVPTCHAVVFQRIVHPDGQHILPVIIKVRRKVILQVTVTIRTEAQVRSVQIHIATAINPIEQDGYPLALVCPIHFERLPIPSYATGQVAVAPAQFRVEILRNAPVVGQLDVLPPCLRCVRFRIFPVIRVQNELPTEVKTHLLPSTICCRCRIQAHHRQG